jgi:hypothetical protein
MQGWIKLHRSISDNDLWLSEPFSYGQAWVDLLINANHKAATIFIRGIQVSLNRGDIGWSEVTLSKRWKWSRGKVRRYLGMLENRGMIVQQTTQVTSVITICNYCLYQSENGAHEQQTEQQTVQQTVQQTDSRRYTNKNVNNEKNEDNIKPTSKSTIPTSLINHHFEELWDSWPTGYGDKGSKKNAQAVYQKIKPDNDLHNTMINALFAQSSDKAAKSKFGEFAPNFPHVERWLKNQRWNDEISVVNFSRTKPTREQRIEQALNEAFGTSDTGSIEGDFETVVGNGFAELNFGRGNG